MEATLCWKRSFFFLLAASTLITSVVFIIQTSFINEVHIRQFTNEKHRENSSKCKPQNYIFFLKTHKTGSSTLASILYRYGDSRNLTFVSPVDNLWDFKWPERLHLSATIPLYTENGKTLCSHTRYNKGPVHFLFPKSKAKYITILRHPVNQFESAFGFYRLTEVLGLEHDINPIQTYLRNPKAFAGKFMVKHPAMLHMGLENIVWNSMMFDLGLESKHFQNKNAVKRYIKYIEEEYDLVLINEYYDESLILMKNELCWDFEDILYLKQRERNARAPLNDEIKANILSLNQADLRLYDHFNETLWRKISKVGPKFHKDLQIFRQMKKAVQEACLQELKKGTFIVNSEEKYRTKYLQMCSRMARENPRYLGYIRKRWKEIWRSVDNPSFKENYEEVENSWDENHDLEHKPVSTSDSL